MKAGTKTVVLATETQYSQADGLRYIEVIHEGVAWATIQECEQGVSIKFFIDWLAHPERDSLCADFLETALDAIRLDIQSYWHGMTDDAVEVSYGENRVLKYEPVVIEAMEDGRRYAASPLSPPRLIAQEPPLMVAPRAA